eukprot:1352397-Lingulodinium_polyedra.AAC.1
MDSSTTPRGEAAVGDCFSSLESRAAVTPVVDENATVQFQAAKRRPPDEEDELDALWSSPFAMGRAMGVTPEEAQQPAARGQRHTEQEAPRT